MDGMYAGFAAVRRPGANTGHGGMALHGRSLIAVYPAMGVLASFRRRHQRPVLAVWLMRHSDEHAMEACQIGSRPGYQGCQACDKVQCFEDDVGSTVAVRCLQLIVNIAARCQRQAPFRYCRAAADAVVPKRLSTLHPCRAMY